MIKTRIAFKTDLTENWNDSIVPERGEICIYSNGINTNRKDSQGNNIYIPKIKFGDGNKNVSQLSFFGGVPISESVLNSILYNENYTSLLDNFTLDNSILM